MSKWILAAVLVAATLVLAIAWLQEKGVADAHAEVLPRGVEGATSIEDRPAVGFAVDEGPSPMGEAPPSVGTHLFEDGKYESPDPAIKGLEDRLYLLELEDRIALANRAMIDQCEPLWGPYWDSGQYEVVESITADFMKDEEGRPRPMQTRFVEGELRVVVLPQVNHPEVWEAFQNLVSMREERSALQLRIKAERGVPQGAGLFGR